MHSRFPPNYGKIETLHVRHNPSARLQLRTRPTARFPFLRWPPQQTTSKRTILTLGPQGLKCGRIVTDFCGSLGVGRTIPGKRGAGTAAMTFLPVLHQSAPRSQSPFFRQRSVVALEPPAHLRSGVERGTGENLELADRTDVVLRVEDVLEVHARVEPAALVVEAGVPADIAGQREVGSAA